MSRLWWVRHAPTGATRITGWTDLPALLPQDGSLERLAALLPAGAPVVSSDLARAVRTAEALAGTRPRLPADPWLREIHFGGWEDRGFAEVEAADGERLRAFWDAPGGIEAPGGESWDRLRARVAAAADALAAAHADVVVVAHLGPILAEVQRARGTAGRDAFAQTIAPLSLTVIVHDAAGLRLERVDHRA